NLAFTVQEAKEGAPAVVISYGKFIQSMIDFAIIAFAIFVAIKGINSLKKEAEEKPAELPKISNEEVLLTEIRDLLKERK
ncbi:MAG: MscL family protein, partial [Candidatus Nitrotoga sp.]